MMQSHCMTKKPTSMRENSQKLLPWAPLVNLQAVPLRVFPLPFAAFITVRRGFETLVIF